VEVKQLIEALKEFPPAAKVFYETGPKRRRNRATALLLSAVARTLVIQTAEHFNMLDRLPV
jgi:hypothetical protein